MNKTIETRIHRKRIMAITMARMAHRSDTLLHPYTNGAVSLTRNQTTRQWLYFVRLLSDGEHTFEWRSLRAAFLKPAPRDIGNNNNNFLCLLDERVSDESVPNDVCSNWSSLDRSDSRQGYNVIDWRMAMVIIYSCTYRADETGLFKSYYTRQVQRQTMRWWRAIKIG